MAGVKPWLVSMEGLWSVLPIEATVTQLAQALRSDVVSAVGPVHPPGAPRHVRVYNLT